MDIKKLKDAHNALGAGRVAMSVLAAVTSAAFVGAFAYDRLSSMLGPTPSVVIAVIVSIIWAFVFDAGIYKLTPFIFNSLANFHDATKSNRKSVLLACAILLLIGMSLSSIYTSLTAASVTVNMVTDKYVPVEAQKADKSQVTFLSTQLASVTKAFNDASKLYQSKRAGTNGKYVALKDRNALKVQMDKLTKQYDSALRKYNRSQGEYDLAATQQNNLEQQSRNEQVTVFATLYRYIGILSTVLFLFFSLCKELLEIEYPTVAQNAGTKQTKTRKTPAKRVRNTTTKPKQQQQVEDIEAETVIPHNVTIAKRNNIGFATAGSEKKQQQELVELMGEENYNKILERVSGRESKSLLNELRARKSRLKNFGYVDTNYYALRVIMDVLKGEKDITKHEQEIAEIMEREQQQ